MQSQFNARTLAEIFRDLYLRERSGVLVLTHGKSERRVHFDRGMILYAESPLEDEGLGAFLVKGGHLSAGALAEATEQGPDSDATSAPALAATLLRRELIGRTTLDAAVRTMVSSIVSAAFAWEGGSGRFNEKPPPETPFETDVLYTVDVILEGIMGMAGFEPIHEAMQGLDNRLCLRRPTPLPLERLTLSPSRGFILSRVDGRSSLNDLISILPPGEEETAVRFLFGLLVLGLVDYDPPVSSGTFKVADVLRDHENRLNLESAQEDSIRRACVQIRASNPYEVLGLRPGATLREVEAAYARAKEQFKRERLLPKVRDKFRGELSLIESRFIESYLTLTNPGASRAPVTKPAAAAQPDMTVSDLNVRVEVDRAKSQVAMDKAHRTADRYYSKARKFLREGDFHNAIQYSRLAITQNPSDARYYATLGDCLARNPEARWQRMAEENYAKATELDPWNAEYWMSLGRLYKRQGLSLRARKQFEEALKLVPNNSEILEELKSLG